MELSTSEKIRVLLKRRNKTITNLAEELKTSRQNLTNKLSRNNFSENDLKQIAEALDCEYSSYFRLRDTDEII